MAKNNYTTLLLFKFLWNIGFSHNYARVSYGLCPFRPYKIAHNAVLGGLRNVVYVIAAFKRSQVKGVMWTHLSPDRQ